MTTEMSLSTEDNRVAATFAALRLTEYMTGNLALGSTAEERRKILGETFADIYKVIRDAQKANYN